MIISEKPTAARKIAKALDFKGSPIEVKKRKSSYFECKRGNDTLIVVYALGHLFELKQTEKGWKYPRLEMEWVPKYEVVKKATDTKYIINLIKRLSKDIDRFVIATDYDIEGSLIGYLTLKYACKADPQKARRMYFSTLTDAELVSAFENADSSLNFPMIEAGHVRHEIDWLYGINLTRALTLAIKKVSGWFKIVSTGRVQGPTLTFVAERDKRINLFVPVPFWNISTLGKYDNHEFELEYSKKRIDRKVEVDAVVKDLAGKTAIVEKINQKTSLQSPPVPFNLSGLQAEAYRHFGFKPSRSLALAQKLYLDALISYPRTSSQKIPKSIDIKKILQGLQEAKQYRDIAKEVLGGKLEPVEGKKEDPAHPSIHPTGEKPSRRLTPSERKLYDLIVRRFLATFGEFAKKMSIRADVTHEEHKLFVRGLRILEKGWMEYYDPYATAKEKILPPISEGTEIQLFDVSSILKHTSAPPRYNHSSLQKTLERESLGTKATRSSIVDSLRSRGYTLSDRFDLSTLGYATYETLSQYIPSVLSTELTRQLEAEMESIRENTNSREQVLVKVKEDLLELLETFQTQEDMIGQALVDGLQRYWKAKEELGPCPKCGDGTLIIIRSPKSGKRFVGCTNYKEQSCDQTFPLPQKGSISPLDKSCPHCDFQMIKVVSGRRTWETCINWTECSGRQEDLKALEERRKKATSKEEGSQ